MPTEAEIRAGGKVITLTMSGATWKTFDDTIRQAIINGLTADGSEPTGWNTVVRDTLSTTAVVRTSSAVCTITLPAFPGYDISADAETVTATIPTSALNSGIGPVASPAFDITKVSAGSGGPDPTIGPVDLDNDDDEVIAIVQEFLRRVA